MFTKIIMKILHNLHQQILFLLIKRIKQSLDHTFMKFSVMTVCFPPLLRKRYINNSTIFLSAFAIYISFLQEVIDSGCKCTNRPAIVDIFFGFLIPIASIICRSLFEISLNSSVITAFSSSYEIPWNKSTTILFKRSLSNQFTS